MFIKDNNSIVFTVDLHLDLPPNIIESVRKVGGEWEGQQGPAHTSIAISVNDCTDSEYH